MIALSAALLPIPFAAGSERVVQNRYTGLAIGGFDPVSYFVDQEPQEGLDPFEVSRVGAVWRFRNEGNLAIFKARPDIYAPQFGGYDPVDVARGAPCAGNPRIWLVSGQRLYLFSTGGNRDAFAARPDRALRAALSQWPRLLTTLADD